jgi:hypothetical protein
MHTTRTPAHASWRCPCAHNTRVGCASCTRVSSGNRRSMPPNSTCTWTSRFLRNTRIRGPFTAPPLGLITLALRGFATAFALCGRLRDRSALRARVVLRRFCGGVALGGLCAVAPRIVFIVRVLRHARLQRHVPLACPVHPCHARVLPSYTLAGTNSRKSRLVLKDRPSCSCVSRHRRWSLGGLGIIQYLPTPGHHLSAARTNQASIRTAGRSRRRCR